MEINRLSFLRKTFFLLVVVLVTSCMSYTTGARRHDLPNRFYKTELTATKNWKMGDDVLVLKRNNTFRYTIKPFGVTTEYYTGSFERRNDTLVFLFTKNNRAYIDKQDDTLSIGYLKNDKPDFFSKSDTLVLTQIDNYGKIAQVLKNTSGDYLFVSTDTPKNKK